MLGLQFHPEMTPDAAASLIEHCRNELLSGDWVQSEEDMMRDPERFQRGNSRMAAILEHLENPGARSRGRG